MKIDCPYGNCEPVILCNDYGLNSVSIMAPYPLFYFKSGTVLHRVKLSREEIYYYYYYDKDHKYYCQFPRTRELTPLELLAQT